MYSVAFVLVSVVDYLRFVRYSPFMESMEEIDRKYSRGEGILKFGWGKTPVGAWGP